MTPKQSIAAGALVTVLGVAVAGTAPVVGTDGSSRTLAQQTVGGVLVVLGWALLAWAIHAFGREKS
jgi:hypothetical protein